MELKELSVKNYRSISKDTGISIQTGRITALAGNNDSGKTAALMAAYLGMMGLFGFQTPNDIQYHRYIGRLNKHKSYNGEYHDDGPIIVCVTFRFTKKDLELLFEPSDSWNFRARRFPFEDILKLLSEVDFVFKVLVDNLFNENNQIFQEKVGLEKFFDEESTLVNLKEKVSQFQIPEHEQDAFCSGLLSSFKNIQWDLINGQILYVPAERQIDLFSMNNSQRFEYKDLMKFRLGIDPRQLLQYVAALRADGNEHLYRQFVDLAGLLYPLKGVEIRDTQFGNDVFIIRDERSEPITRSGTGIAQVLYICARVLETAQKVSVGPTIVLFDEPEIGLHPGLQKSLIGLMMKLSEQFDVQWIVSSHSPFVFREIDSTEGDSLWSIRHDGNKSIVRNVLGTESVKELYSDIGLNLPAILTASAVIFCEGSSEVHFIPKVLKKAGVNVDTLLIVPLGGINNLSNISPSDLMALHPKSLLILDWDEGDITENKERETYIESGMTVYCKREWKALENTYPPEAVSRAFECTRLPEINPFDNIKDIVEAIKVALPQKPVTRKSKMAEKVASAMTEQECREHPLVMFICDWLKR
ncbi:ATP-dependent nuclease [Desulfosporosinus sp. SB140]|uniref:ATP-dependent nuclease n=1 Tax=Desulfosporosinus paludis TaxID=3115649 RepID=UPI0038908D36